MYVFGLILYAFYIAHCALSDLLNKCSIFSHIVSKHFIYIACVCISYFKNYFIFLENVSIYSFNYLRLCLFSNAYVTMQKEDKAFSLIIVFINLEQNSFKF